MKGHHICFCGEIRLIITKLFQLHIPLLIWSTASTIKMKNFQPQKLVYLQLIKNQSYLKNCAALAVKALLGSFTFPTKDNTENCIEDFRAQLLNASLAQQSHVST